MKQDRKFVPCFELAEKLCVDGGRHIADFVEKYPNACVNVSTSLASQGSPKPLCGTEGLTDL